MSPKTDVQNMEDAEHHLKVLLFPEAKDILACVTTTRSYLKLENSSIRCKKIYFFVNLSLVMGISDVISIIHFVMIDS